MNKLSILTVLLLSIIFGQQGSDIPNNMSFQGFLTDSEGVAYVDGEYDLVFRLIRQIDETTEQTIWEEFHSASVTNGVFSVILGSVTPIPLSISPNVQLETQVGDEILSPRQPLTSVPFALKSSRAQQAFQGVLSDTAQFAFLAETAGQATEADTAALSHHSVYADTANYALGIVGGIEVDNVQNATFADTAYYVEQAQNSLTANEATSAINSTYADTAYFVQESQSSILANEALTANNSTYSDTAYYVQQAQSALTAVTSENSTNATYADTAIIVDLSSYNGNINVQGSVTATSFVGNGSALTGISSVESLMDLGLTATETELNYVDGVTSEIQNQLDAKQDKIPTGIGQRYIEITISGQYGAGYVDFDLDQALGSTNSWYHIEPMHITEWDGNSSYFYISLSALDNNTRNKGSLSITKQNDWSGPQFENDYGIYSYSNDGQHNWRVVCYGRDTTIKILLRVTSDWSS